MTTNNQPAGPLWPFIPHRATTLLIGPRGSFKTSVAWAIASAVSTGAFLGSLATDLRPVVFDSNDMFDDLDQAAIVAFGNRAAIQQPSDSFGLKHCDNDCSAIDESELMRVAEAPPADALIVIDDFERVGPLGSSNADRDLSRAIVTIACNARESTSVLVTLTATPEELGTKFRSFAAQFDTVLQVERWCGENVTLRVLHSKSAPELFEIDGVVQFAEIAQDAQGNSIRHPAAKFFPIAAHNQRL